MECPDAPRLRGADLRALIEEVSEGLVLARAGRVVWANAAFAVLAGCDAAERVCDLPVDELWDGPPPAPTPSGSVECGLRRWDGDVRPVAVRCARGEGEGDLVFGVRDLVPLRALESELDSASRALAEANGALDSLRERLQRELAERDELLTVVSHELRTPVTVITGYNRLMLAEKVGSLTGDQRRFLHESNKSCRRLSDFIANLLELARASRGELRVQTSDASLEPTIQGVVGFLEPLLAEHRLRIEIELDPDATSAHFDPVRIEQVLTNLIGNAIKYAPPGGRVSIATAPLEVAGQRFVEVSVEDDGPGVTREERERIFEPYVRAGHGRKAGGLGLGLSICRQIVEAHGGAIRVTEPPGGGARFSFSLPIDRLPRPQSHAPSRG